MPETTCDDDVIPALLTFLQGPMTSYARQGMSNFRRTYPRVFWVFDKFEPQGERQVKFGFQRYWTDPVTGMVKMVTAEEVISFDQDGMITAITYAHPPSEPITTEYPAGADPQTFTG